MNTAVDNPDYPLDAAWLATAAICPRLPGFESFDQGVRHYAEQLAAEGRVDLRYGCLSSFEVTITNGDSLPRVTVRCGPRSGSMPLALAHACPRAIASGMNMLADDARALAYLLRHLGASLPTAVAA